MEEELLEPEYLIRTITMVIALSVTAITLLAYYRTRIRRVLVLALLSALLTVDMLLEVGDEFLEDGVPYFELVTGLFGLGIAVLLLLTVVWRFEWREP